MWGALYEGMRVENKIGKYYYFIILLRGVLLLFLITFGERVPFLQIIPMIYFNAGLVYFFFKKQTVFSDLKLNNLNRVKEVLILVSEICIVFLNFRADSEEYYDVLGWLIVGSLGFVLITELVYLIGSQIFNVKKNFRKIVEAIKGVLIFFHILENPKKKADGKIRRRADMQIIN